MAQQREALKALGLRIKVIEGDGNCLFRAIADQVLGFWVLGLGLSSSPSLTRYMEGRGVGRTCACDLRLRLSPAALKSQYIVILCSSDTRALTFEEGSSPTPILVLASSLKPLYTDF